MSNDRKPDADVNSGGRDVTDAGELAGPGDETQPGTLELERRAAADRQIEAIEGRPAEDVRALELPQIVGEGRDAFGNVITQLPALAFDGMPGLEFKVQNRGTAAAPVFAGIVGVRKPEGVNVESVHVDGQKWEPPARGRPLQPGDVIQLDPERGPWGALFAIVDEVKPWGVTCYWLHATERGKAPAVCPYRAETGSFVRIGAAEWTVGS